MVGGLFVNGWLGVCQRLVFTPPTFDTPSASYPSLLLFPCKRLVRKNPTFNIIAHVLGFMTEERDYSLVISAVATFFVISSDRRESRNL